MDDKTIDLTDGPKHRAEDVQPRGFVPSHLAAPMLRGSATTALEYAALELGGIRLAADLIAHGETLTGDKAAVHEIGETATRLQRLLRALASGALIVALAVTGLVVSGGSTPAAAATVAGKTWTSAAAVPSIEAPQPDPAPAKHRTVFGRGYWFDQCSGSVYVVAPLRELVPSIGWLPSPWAKVVVQEQTRQGVRTRGALTRTNTDGLARGLVQVGGGVRYLRVVHPADFWTLGTVGTWRRVVVTTEPCDVI